MTNKSEFVRRSNHGRTKISRSAKAECAGVCGERVLMAAAFDYPDSQDLHAAVRNRFFRALQVASVRPLEAERDARRRN